MRRSGSLERFPNVGAEVFGAGVLQDQIWEEHLDRIINEAHLQTGLELAVRRA